MKEISNTKITQFTKKQLKIAELLAQGYSYRDIEREGVCSYHYVWKMRKNCDFNKYVYSLLEEWQKTSKNELILIAKQKVRELANLKPKKDLLDYLDYLTKLTGNYAPGKYELEHKYSESDINARFEELLADLGRIQENAGVIDIRGLRQPN